MLEEFLEELKQYIQQNQSFVLCRLPNQNEIQLWGHKDNHSQRLVIQNFMGTQSVTFLNDSPLKIKSSEFNGKEINYKTPRLELEGDQFKENMMLNETSYLNLIQKAIDEIKTTELQKVVITRKKVIKKVVNPFIAFHNLEANYSNAFVYLWHENGVFWLGATPETLASYKGNHFRTMSLAGTKNINEKWSQKEFEEQQLVTDYIIKILKLYGEVDCSRVKTVDYGEIQHLGSEITCTINNKDQIKGIINKLHPTPAVCGVPKQKALHFIRNEEGYDRTFYTGYIGIENQNRAHYFVNLRCAQISHNQTTIYAGGGITNSSIPEKEWLETELKANSLFLF